MSIPYLDTSNIKPFSGFRLTMRDISSPKFYENRTSFDEWWGNRIKRDLFIKSNIDLFIVCGTLERVQEKFRRAVELSPEGLFEFDIIENVL